MKRLGYLFCTNSEFSMARKTAAKVTHILHVVDHETGKTTERRLACTPAQATEVFEEECAEGRGEVYLYAADYGVHDLLGALLATGE